MTEVLYRKWRPQSLTDVVGQEPVTRTLRQAVATGRIAHAYLFTGPRGTGKTSSARILAKAVNCRDPQDGEPDNGCEFCLAVNESRALDLIEIDAASNRGIDDIRNLKEKIHFSPNEALYKVYILDEVHMLTEPAFNALLKTLEEPPGHAIFVLATTEPHKVPLTIISRCQRFDFRRISLDSMTARLAEICAGEGATASQDALTMVARASSGSLRDAVNLIEQVIVSYGDEVTEDHVRDLLDLGGDEEALDLVGNVIDKDVNGALAVVSKFAGEGADLRQLHRAATEYLRGVLLAKTDNLAALGYTSEVAGRLQELAGQATMAHVVRALKSFSKVDLRRDVSSSLPLELAIVESSMEQEPAVVQPPPVSQPPPVPAPSRPSGAGATPGARAASAAGPPSAPPPRAAPSYQRPANTQAGADAARPRSGPPSEVDRGWTQLVHSLRTHKGRRYNLGALLRACVEREVTDSEIVLKFNHRSHMERMQEELEDPPTRKVLLEALANAMGEGYDVRVSVVGDRGTNGSQSAAGKSHLVKAAQQMGARVVDEKEEAVEQEHAAPGPAAPEKDDEAPGGA